MAEDLSQMDGQDEWPNDNPDAQAGAQSDGDALATLQAENAALKDQAMRYLDEADEAAGAEAALFALRAENAALKDQAMRYAAEIENTKRRSEREANDARAYAIQKFARDLLDAADNLSRALQAAPKDSSDPATRTLVQGVDMTEKALQTAFERNGLKRVEPARGEKFDPNLHQAMMEQPAEGVPPGAVIQVLQTGYELFGRIVRPALVAVTPKGSAVGSGGGDPYAAADPGEVGGSVNAKA